MARQAWQQAESLIRDSLAINEQLRNPGEIAYQTVKLGQVAQAKDDLETARDLYQQGLAIFERLGMAVAGQVRAMLAALEPGGQPSPQAMSPDDLLVALAAAAAQVVAGQQPAQPLHEALAGIKAEALPADHAGYVAALEPCLRAVDDGARQHLLAAVLALQTGLPLAFGVESARLFAALGDPAAAVQCQTGAIALLRAQPGDAAAQHLSVLLFNQAGYLADAHRLDEAVAALEEVVAIDEALGLDDLASDRAALAAMRRRRQGLPADDGAPAIPPEDLTALMAQMEQQLADLPPEQRQQARHQLEALSQLSPDELAAEMRAMNAAHGQSEIDIQAQDVVDAVLDAAGPSDIEALLPKLDQAAAIYAENEDEGSDFHQLAQFVSAVAALLRGQAVPPMPARFAEQFAAVREGIGGW